MRRESCMWKKKHNKIQDQERDERWDKKRTSMWDKTRTGEMRGDKMSRDEKIIGEKRTHYKRQDEKSERRDEIMWEENAWRHKAKPDGKRKCSIKETRQETKSWKIWIWKTKQEENWKEEMESKEESTQEKGFRRVEMRRDQMRLCEKWAGMRKERRDETRYVREDIEKRKKKRLWETKESTQEKVLWDETKRVKQRWDETRWDYVRNELRW